MEEQKLSETESLQLIQDMINRAKNSVIDKGTWAIFWGAIIFVCSITTYVEIERNKWLPFNIFFLTLLALAFQIAYVIYQKKHGKHSNKPTGRSSEAITIIWIAFTVSMLIVSFVPVHSNNLVFLVLYGIPTFATGAIIKFNPMTIGGIICWICAIISAFIPSKYYLLLMAFSALTAWLIPGLIMRSKYLKVKRKLHV